MLANCVHDHLLGAEWIARRREAQSLGRMRHLVRRLLLDELAHYRRSLRYPKNRDFRAKAVPYFVDEDGTRCAMAHLLEVGGQRDLVSKIACERNHAQVSELADDNTLVAWLSAAGLSLQEAARIQPSYCSQEPADRCFCNGLMSKQTAEGTIVMAGSGTSEPAMPATVRIDRIGSSTTDVRVGDMVQLSAFGETGATILVSIHGPVDAGNTVTEVGLVTGGGAQCLQGLDDSFSRTHLVPVSALEQALSADDKLGCEAALQAVDPGWVESCRGGCGCALADAAHLGSGPAVTTAAILAAILHYRRRQTTRYIASRIRSATRRYSSKN